MRCTISRLQSLGLVILVAGSWAPAAENPPAEPMPLDQAIERMTRYNEGDSRQAVIAVERAVFQATADAAGRAAMTQRLLQVLASKNATPAAKSLVCRWLPMVATDDDAAVGPLSGLLGDASTRDMACRGLAGIGRPASGTALRDALNALKGDERVCVIQALGELRDPEAVKTLKPLLEDGGPAVTDATIWALGSIGTASAAEALLSRPLPPGPALHDALLRCAEACHKGKDDTAALRVYEQLAQEELPPAVRLTGLAGLHAIKPEVARPRLIEALDAGDEALASGALDLLVDQFQAARTAAACRRAILPKYLAKEDGTLRPVAVRMLAAVADRSVIEQFLRMLDDARTRPAAVEALAEIIATAPARDLELSLRAIEKLRAAGAPAETLERLRTAEELAGRVVGQGPNGFRLTAYLDCGAPAEAGPSRPRIRQLTGAWHTWPGAEVHGPIGSVAYDPKEVVFELNDLDPGSEYVLGLTWWDFDANGRIQSVRFGSGEPVKWTTVLPPGPAVANYQGKPTWAQIYLPISKDMAVGRKMQVSIYRDGGPSNAVVSELWLLERDGGKSAARPTKRVAIVTGDEYPGHWWRQTAPELAKVLRADSRLEVTILETPMILASPLLGHYDAVVLNYNNDSKRPDGGEPVWSGLQKYVESGRGLVMVHFACGAFSEWEGFVKLAGRVYDPKLRPHDPYGKFAVKITDRSHPITAGLSDFETADELYTCLAGDTPIRLLAESVSVVDKKPYPMGFVLDVSKGRVFHSPLGHDLTAFKAEGVRELYRRATAWAAGLEPVSR